MNPAIKTEYNQSPSMKNDQQKESRVFLLKVIKEKNRYFLFDVSGNYDLRLRLFTHSLANCQSIDSSHLQSNPNG